MEERRLREALRVKFFWENRVQRQVVVCYQ